MQANLLTPLYLGTCITGENILFQVRLYEDFAKSRAKQTVDDTVAETGRQTSQGSTHVFQVNTVSEALAEVKRNSLKSDGRNCQV